MYKKFEKLLKKELGENFTFKVEHDLKGIASCWCVLDKPSLIKEVALVISNINGRLVTVTAAGRDKEDKRISYHFDLDGVICTVTIVLENNEVISITPIIKAADWTERELQELYDIKLIGHPNNKRLFLEENIEEGIMNKYISLSEAMAGSSTQTLWEKVLEVNTQGEKR